MIRIRGIQPFYWGVETRDPERLVPFDEKVLTRAWMVEDRAPWRRSIVAIRLRIGGYGLHIGLCRRQRPDERPWRGKYYPPTDIGKFRRLVEDEDADLQEEAAGSPTGEQPVRQDGVG